MSNIINNWGNSLGFRIPQPIANKVSLIAGTVVSIKKANALMLRVREPIGSNKEQRYWLQNYGN
jgi:antitoxin component of MazEF toxin-antitoxin module